ncbi:MAG: oxygen-independent coproporphyrinogen III oxidase [Alphaproteobacteria bacterium]
MTPELLEKYGQPVPRYTSYPTAPNFIDAVGAPAYRDWLEAVDLDEPLSLYLHVPFCDTLCWFCGCHTKIVNRYSPVAAYVEALTAEIDLVADIIGARAPVGHLHFGGGSPTILRGGDFTGLMERLRRRFEFLPEAEIAIEIDPRGMTREAVDTLAAGGVSRVSIGVQDLNPEVQQAVNRVQPLELTEQLIGWCRDAGIGGINIDLMYGLPRQTIDGVAETAARIAGLHPDRIALFGYAHVPWMKRHQRLIDEAALPDIAERWRQSEAAAEVLGEAGYLGIGLDHFAAPRDPLAGALKRGRLRRNFQGYTVDEARVLLGFGASAIGDVGKGYVQNSASIGGYMKSIAGGRLATARGIALSADDRLRREIIERLMCDLEVDLDRHCHAFGASAGLFDPEFKALRPLIDDGLLKVSGHDIRVTERGRPLVRVVASVFDRYLEKGAGRHSRAV